MATKTVDPNAQDRDATQSVPVVSAYRAGLGLIAGAAARDGRRGASGYAARLRRDPSGHVVTASLAMLAAALMFVAQSAWAASPAPDGPEAAATRLASAIMTDTAATPEPGLDGDTASVALPGAWATGLAPGVQRWAAEIEAAVQANPAPGLTPRLVGCMMGQESAGAIDAESEAGASGLMQIHPPSHPAYDVARGIREPAYNIGYGVGYISDLLTQYSGDVTTALVHYNGGGRAVAQYRAGTPFAETRTYLATIPPCAGEG